MKKIIWSLLLKIAAELNWELALFQTTVKLSHSFGVCSEVGYCTLWRMAIQLRPQ